ncbi:MAG: hypothetical protein DRP88_01765 [Candidatus Neomarinimicrobiota bacterium]|nr:MAG: hypothetical protein DRP88_01765 [Candidatus Neomarinimicrobiota bacterium]
MFHRVFSHSDDKIKKYLISAKKNVWIVAKLPRWNYIKEGRKIGANMRKVKECYLKILKIELEDLKDDIEQLIEETRKEKDAGKLTNYVFFQNIALFKNELLGLNVFEGIIESTNPEDFDNLDEMIVHLKERFFKKIKTLGLAEAIRVYVGRKMTKAKRYVVERRV